MYVQPSLELTIFLVSSKILLIRVPSAVVRSVEEISLKTGFNDILFSLLRVFTQFGKYESHTSKIKSKCNYKALCARLREQAEKAKLDAESMDGQDDEGDDASNEGFEEGGEASKDGEAAGETADEKVVKAIQAEDFKKWVCGLCGKVMYRERKYIAHGKARHGTPDGKGGHKFECVVCKK